MRGEQYYPPIGVCGYKRAGKDTVARILQTRFAYHIRGYSEVLKEHLYHALSPEVRGDMDTFLARVERDKTLPPEAEDGWCRQLLQSWGQAHRVLGGPTYWTRWLVIAPRQVIPSVRHPEEIVQIRGHGGLIWRVRRPGTAPDGHPSEAHALELDADAELHNDGTPWELGHQISTLMAHLGLKETT